MLLALPWPWFLIRNEAGRQPVDLTMLLAEFPVQQPDAGHERGDVSAGRFGRTRSYLHRQFAQNREDVSRIETADTIALDEGGNRLFADTRSLGRRWRGLPEIEQPLGAEVAFQLKHCGKITPELLAHAVCQAIAFRAEVFGHPRPFTQFYDDRIGTPRQPIASRIGTQGRCHDLSISAVVFGSAESEAVAETIHLLRVDGMHLEATLDQRFDDGAVRNLDRDLDSCRMGRTARRHQPGGHRGKAFASVLEYPFADLLAAAVGQEHMMAFRSPVDASIPLALISHATSVVRVCEPPRPSPIPVLALGRQAMAAAQTPHGASITGQFAGARVPPGGQATRGGWLLPANRLGSGRYANSGHRCVGYAPFGFVATADLKRKGGRSEANYAARIANCSARDGFGLKAYLACRLRIM